MFLDWQVKILLLEGFFYGLYLLVMFHVGECCAVVSAPCSLVVTCWEKADLMAVVLIVFVIFPIVSWSTSKLRARLASWNWFKVIRLQRSGIDTIKYHT